jgi:cysteine desulfurase family protein (TIGR01976 family)
MINETTHSQLPIAQIRAQFPGLAPGQVQLDGAAGTQVPEAVIAAVAEAMRAAMANVGGAFAASRLSTEVVAEARGALADLVGGVPEGVVLGPNMTTLTFHLADALSRTWKAGDEIVVTSLDHDANVRPWVLAAERADATVRVAEVDTETGELPVEAVQQVLSDRTRLVAVTAASNAIGTRPDVPAIAALAHDRGALTYVDGVHATPHVPVDVGALRADFYACSSYKFYGPHTGAVIADPDLLARLHPAKLVPAPKSSPGRFERGTPPFELLAGVRAAIDWLAGLADGGGSRRQRLLATFTALDEALHQLLIRLLDGLSRIEGVRLLGAPQRRTSTVSFVLEGYHPDAVAAGLAERGVDVWSGDNYAYELMRRFGLAETGGAVRASIVLYNTAEDVDRLLDGVAELATGRSPIQ